jgi:hypothetical protein
VPGQKMNLLDLKNYFSASRNFELSSQIKGSSINFDYCDYLTPTLFTAAMDTDMLAVISDL